jgi:hypothetical protein
MCRREVIKLHNVNTIQYPRIPIYTKFPNLIIVFQRDVVLDRVSKGLERTGTNHVFNRLGKREGEPAEAWLPKYRKPEGESAEARLPNHGKADAPLPKHGKRLSIRAILHWANGYDKEPPM